MVVFLSGNQTSIVCGQESGCPHCPGSWGASWASVSRTVETREESPLASFIITEYGTMVHTLYSLLYIEASEMKLNPPSIWLRIVYRKIIL